MLITVWWSLDLLPVHFEHQKVDLLLFDPRTFRPHPSNVHTLEVVSLVQNLELFKVIVAFNCSQSLSCMRSLRSAVSSMGVSLLQRRISSFFVSLPWVSSPRRLTFKRSENSETDPQILVTRKCSVYPVRDLSSLEEFVFKKSLLFHVDMVLEIWLSTSFFKAAAVFASSVESGTNFFAREGDELSAAWS